MKKIFLLIFFLLVVLCTVYATGTYPPVDNNMVGYYHMDQNASRNENDTFVNDSSPSQNNLFASAVNKAIYNSTGGFLGRGGYEFNGVNQYYKESTNTSSTNLINSPLTLSLWFKINQGQLGLRQGLAGRTFSSTRYSYGCLVDTANNTVCQINYANGTLVSLNAGTNSVVADTWYFATLTYDPIAAQDNVILYINGIRSKSSNLSAGNLTASGTYGFVVGRWGGNNQNYLNGTVGEIILYNRTLTAGEVWNTYSTYYGCFTPTDGMQFNGNTTLCTGTYYLNGSSTGALKLTNNMVLNGNGSVFIGNYSDNPATELRFINSPLDNSTITNLTIQNYYRGVYSSTTLRRNANVINVTFKNNKFGYTSLSGLADSYITNNTFINNENAIYFGNSSNNFILGNNFINTSSGFGVESLDSQNNTISYNIFDLSHRTAAIDFRRANNSIADNNIIHGGDILGSSGLRISNASNIRIENNYFDDSQYNILFTSFPNYNITILNNTILSGDEGSVLYGADTVYIINNTIFNMTKNYDGYNVGLKIINSSNVYLIGNNFSEIATAAIISQGVSNLSITNNSFSFIPLSSRSSYQANDGFEPRCTIQSTQRYKGFYQTYGNTNLTVLDNDYGSNNPCYLHLENQTGLFTDISNYWYSSFVIYDNVSGLNEFYVPLSYNNLSRYSTSQGVQYDFRVGWGSLGSHFSVAYNVSYGETRIKNINSTNSFYVNYYNLSTALLYYSNSSTSCFNITSCNGQNLVLLTKNNYSHVSNNFNLTENVSRQNSPLWVVSKTINSSGIIYHLGNNLTSTLNDVTFIPLSTTPCGSLSYTSKNGAYINTVTKTCSNGYITSITIDGYETSNDSNVLIINNDYVLHNIAGSGTSGSINGATWNTDGLTKVLVSNTDFNSTTNPNTVTLYYPNTALSYTPALFSIDQSVPSDGNSILGNYTEALSDQSSQPATWLTIGGIIILVSIIGAVLYIFKDNIFGEGSS